MQRFCLLLLLFAAGCAAPSRPSVSAGHDADSMFAQIADAFLEGYLAWRPQMAVGLGLHQYDGKVTDLSRSSLDGELARLKRFDRQLAGLQTEALSQRAFYDYCLLRATIQKELFRFEEK